MQIQIVLAFAIIAIVYAAGEEGVKSGTGVGKLRAAAGEATVAGDMAKATSLWNEVLTIEPDSSNNYYGRFRVYLRQNKMKEAMSDLNKVLDLEPSHEQALGQRAKLTLRMGRCSDAVEDFVKLKAINANSKELSSSDQASRCEIAQRHANNQYERQQYHAAREHFNQAIQYTIISTTQQEQCTDMLLKRAHCSFHMGDWHQVISDCGKVLKGMKDNLDALTLRGNAYYALGELDTAKEHYRQALHFDPEHNDSKQGHRLTKKVGSALSKSQNSMTTGQYAEAVKHLNNLLNADPNHQVFVVAAWGDLGEAYRKLGEYDLAKENIFKIIERDSNNWNAHKIHGNIVLDQEDYEEAVKIFRHAHELSGGDASVQQDLQRAEAALKQSKQKDYYKILGVPRNSQIKQIKKAYREKALEWHPDKHQGEVEKEKAEKQFQLVAEAYEILSDKELRGKYDRGEEVFPNQGNEGQGQGHPFQHFHQGGHPFNGGGGHSFHFNFG